MGSKTLVRRMRCLAWLALPVALAACDLESKTKTQQGYLEQAGSAKADIDDHRELVSFFDALWQSVCWEVLARERLAAHLSNQASDSFDFFVRADGRAREVFWRRYGVQPPEKYFPPMESEFSAAFGPAAAWQKKDWSRLLRQAGLNSTADIEPHLRSWDQERREREELERRADQLAESRGIAPYDALRALQVAELMRALDGNREVNMRTLPHVSQLDLLARQGLAEATTDGVEIHWRLSDGATDALHGTTALDLALEIVARSAESCLDVVGPLLHDRYFGLGMVREAAGRSEGPDSWISVEVTAGVAFQRRPRFAGDSIVVGAGDPDLRILGQPAEGDLVGFLEEPSCHPDDNPLAIWEKIPTARPPDS